MKLIKKFPAELRLDAVTQDWVIIATGRAKRPEMFKKYKEETPDNKDNCPFCAVERMPLPLAAFVKGESVSFSGRNVPSDWSILVVPNKFPAVAPSKIIKEETEGDLYRKVQAVGFHEVIVLKEHDVALTKLSESSIKELIDVYQQRYLTLAREKFVNHIAIFHNHGPSAGASINHPHSQIITTPLVDADLQRAAHAASAYFQKHGECVYCKMNHWELKVKKRLVAENNNFLAVCPFASKSAFEVVISPKNHLSYFEKATEAEKTDLAAILQQVLLKLEKGLGNPDYNYYLYTAPSDGQKYSFYHWNWTIVPKISVQAGFEIGTRMEISTIEPEKAAAYLKNIA